MDPSSSTILVTGGASGIGYALAAGFLRSGSRVIICGRRDEKLREARAEHPELDIRACDLGREVERVVLFDWAVETFPGVNRG